MTNQAKRKAKSLAKAQPLNPASFVIQQPNPFRYFVSYILMQGGNPFGHASMVISQLDKREPNAQVEVLECAGFYSRYSAYTQYQFVAEHGRVKTEEVKDLVNCKNLSHMSFEITEAQMLKLLRDINEDRRQVQGDRSSKMTVPEVDENDNLTTKTVEYYKPSGPQFNLFKGKNCKRYVLEKFEALGIDIRWMSGLLEIPVFSQGLQPLEVVKAERAGHAVYCWRNPLLITPYNRDQEPSLMESTTQQFYALQQGVNKIQDILLKRQQQLEAQGTQVVEIAHTLAKVSEIKAELAAVQNKPNQITDQYVNRSYANLANHVDTCVKSLHEKNIEQDLIHQLIDTLAETYRWISHYLFGARYSAQPNSKDGLVVQQIDEVQHNLPKIAPR